MTCRIVLRWLPVAILTVITTYAFAGEVFDENENGVALNRYDPVSYFTATAPVLGIRSHIHEHRGAKFYFISAYNRDRFAENPERYTPQFGGYCAYGILQGSKVKSRPRAFAIVDKKLYLFSGSDALREWKKDVSGNIVRANEQWLESSKLVRKD